MKNTLKVTTPTDRQIVITRALDASRHLVWQAMTTPALIRRWLFLPPGWEMTTCEDDARVGGTFHWAWNDPEGKPAMSLRGTYREVVPPGDGGRGGRIVRTESFEFGCVPQAGEQLATMVLTEQAGKTLVTITVLYPSKEARDGAIASGMERGMAAGYDKMEELLATMAR